jgi:hypothetical protein
MWQDTVIAVCQLMFVPALLPTMRGADKPALSSCVLNASIISVIAFTQATLGLWFSTATSATTIAAWLVLAVQKWRTTSTDRDGLAVTEPAVRGRASRR